MQKWWQKIILFVAVTTIIGHNSLPHHHHDAFEAVAHHHEHDEDHDAHHHEQETEHHHNLFSFAQLDEDFLLSQFSKANIDLPILYLLIPVITYSFQKIKEQSKTHFGFYREFPPPDKYSSQLFSRPPPVAFAA
jgi:hypothetical protein